MIDSATPPTASIPSSRFERLDALRGFALLWMAAFHFCFDLSQARLIEANFYQDAFWTGQRTAILSLFLLCAGAGQAVAVAQGQSWTRFWRRWAQVVACALAVSVGSYAMFSGSYIYFGVLHGMALMLIVARLSAGLKAWLWPMGAVALLLPTLFQHPVFDSRALNWVGLVTHKPITEDYVPILPWLGVMWWGLAATQVLMQRWPQLLRHQTNQQKIVDSNAGAQRLMKPLAWLGGWSLSFYMLHQPIMLGTLHAFLYFSANAP